MKSRNFGSFVATQHCESSDWPRRFNLAQVSNVCNLATLTAIGNPHRHVFSKQVFFAVRSDSLSVQRRGTKLSQLAQ